MEQKNASTSIFSHPPHSDDTVFYTIYPDPSPTLSLPSLHFQIISFLHPFTSSYIFQHQPFTLSPSPTSPSHLHGSLRYGDNIDDEWFTVFLLFQTSRRFPSLSIRVWDSDGEFLLIESAFHLPRWLTPETSHNRIFIRNGSVHVIPRSISNPGLTDSLTFLINNESKSIADDSIQTAIQNRIRDYPDKAERSMQRVRVRVPVRLAQVLKHEPCLIALAVEGFYDRDVDSMKYAARMETFAPAAAAEEVVLVAVRIPRAMYAQLRQQKFHAPKCYPMRAVSSGGDVGERLEEEIGMKIACGLEMAYWERKKEGEEGKGSMWEKYKESLEKCGYFDGNLPGAKDYDRLMENAQEYYKNSALFSRTSEIMSAPVRRIDEILGLPYATEDFKHQDVPPSDDDSWLYGGEDELNNALQERQKEMDLYNAEHRKKPKEKEPQDTAGPSSSASFDNFDLGDVTKTMQAFMDKVSSYEGAEVPENRDLKEVDLDVERFLKDMESVAKYRRFEENASDVDIEEGSSSDMEFDESEDGSDVIEPSEDNNDGEDTFMHAYSDALNEELSDTTLKKSFVCANEQPSKNNEGTSKVREDVDEEFAPVDVDFNLVKSFLDSFSSQQGLPGPATNLLGLMGLQLPHDSNEGK